MRRGILKVTHQIRQLPRHLRQLRPAWLAGALAVVLAADATLVAWQTQAPLNVRLADQSSVSVTGPLRLAFGQQVAADFAAEIQPVVPGAWHSQHSVLGVAELSFQPSSRFEAGMVYTVRIRHLHRALTGAQLPDIVQVFRAQIPPDVQSARPVINATDVSTRPELSMTLAAPNRGVRDVQARLYPQADLRLVNTDDKTFMWQPIHPLKQGVNYLFMVEDGRMPADKSRLVTVAFTTVAEPQIVSARSGGYFAPGQTVDIVFDRPMAPDTNAFSFDLTGKGSWINTETYRFVPDSIKPGETHTYVVKAGAKSAAGGVVEADHQFQFATNGAVGASISPAGGGVDVSAPVRVAFDMPVDRASAQARFSMSPATAGVFSWSGNTMTYTPTAPWAYQSGYSLAVAPGVVPVWGLPSNHTLSASFTTAPQIIQLGVPAYKAHYTMSCELTALRMVLGFYGIGMADEAEIVYKMGYNPRARDQATNSWDNPNKQYVGYLNGGQNFSGYGVHAGPIAAAAGLYGHSATDSYNVSAAYISQQIHAGHPVIFWGHSTPAKADSWNTPDGVVQTWLSSHGRVAYGVQGSADNPIGFYIIDPMNGGKLYWTAAQLMANMNIIPGVSNQTVVVY